MYSHARGIFFELCDMITRTTITSVFGTKVLWRLQIIAEPVLFLVIAWNCAYTKNRSRISYFRIGVRSLTQHIVISFVLYIVFSILTS